mmetsp:Transcript_81526/g.243008  ORF Transcript_81526/g.243008 Transcript_81526/m.243008 type:complete len:212 (-) Transcript_81526:9-644(-)
MALAGQPPAEPLADAALSALVRAAVDDAVAPLRQQVQDLLLQVQSLSAELRGASSQTAAGPAAASDGMGAVKLAVEGPRIEEPLVTPALELLVRREVRAVAASCRALHTAAAVLASQEHVSQALTSLQQAQAWSDVDLDDVQHFDTGKLYRLTTGEVGWRYTTNVLRDYVISMSHNISLMVLCGDKRTVVLRDPAGHPTTLDVARMQCRCS